MEVSMLAKSFVSAKNQKGLSGFQKREKEVVGWRTHL